MPHGYSFGCSSREPFFSFLGGCNGDRTSVWDPVGDMRDSHRDLKRQMVNVGTPRSKLANRRILADGKRPDRGTRESGPRYRGAHHYPTRHSSYKTAPASIWYAATDIGRAFNPSAFVSGSFFNAIAISARTNH